jgi:hypothetical protein
MTRKSNPSDSLLVDVAATLAVMVPLVCGCASGQAWQFDTQSEPEEEPRRAPGVAIDRAAELPPPVPTTVTGVGVAQLTTPPDSSLARQTVRKFLELMLRGSFRELEAIIDEQAWFNTGPSGGRQRARHFMQTRLARVDYSKLSLNSLYRQADVETYRAEDIPHLGKGRSVPRVVQGSDVLVRVFISTPRVGRTRVFGDEVSFVLRPSEQGFSVIEILEDFQLP